MAKDDGSDCWTFGTFIATPESDLARYRCNKETDGRSRHGDNDEEEDGGSGGGGGDGNHNSSSNNKNNNVPWWFLEHMRRQFGDVPGLVSLVSHAIQHGEVRPHPQYEFGATNRVHNGRVVLLGDAAHMASPRTAVGAHTAVLDAVELRSSLRTIRDVDEAMLQYSTVGLAHARQLYDRTKLISRQFVPQDGGIDAILSPETMYSQDT
jgi:2-polyprenyl-6-methoxyphenol hydroxylase-like FAD-dependent oxidoreductase